MKKAMQDKDVKRNGKSAVKFIQYVSKHRDEFEGIVSEKDESNILKSFKEQLSKEFKCNITIENSTTQNPKKQNAMPMKPAIFIE